MIQARRAFLGLGSRNCSPVSDPGGVEPGGGRETGHPLLRTIRQHAPEFPVSASRSRRLPVQALARRLGRPGRENSAASTSGSLISSPEASFLASAIAQQLVCPVEAALQPGGTRSDGSGSGCWSSGSMIGFVADPAVPFRGAEASAQWPSDRSTYRRSKPGP